MQDTHQHDGSREVNQPDTSSPSENDKRPWQEKAILSFDGGGVRGYASLLIVEALMDAIKEKEMSHPDGPHTSSFQLPKLSGSPVFTTVTEQARSLSAPAIDCLNVRTPSWRTKPQYSITRSSEKTETLLKPLETEGLYLPCHYFDYMFGTSTGGLNAIMLSRLRMDVQTCTGMYSEMVREIFGSPRLTSLKGVIKSKHDPVHLENEVKRLVKDRMPEEYRQHNTDTRFHRYPSPPDLCRTVVFSKEIQEYETVEVERQYRFRTYNHDRSERNQRGLNYGPADEVTIWQAARATSAALPYLRLIKIGGHKYSDGGVLYNNPTKEAYDEVLSKEGRHPFPFTLIVSIGTGKKPGDSSWERPARKREVVIDLAETAKKNPFRVLRHPRTTISNAIKNHPLVRAARRAIDALTNSEQVHRDMEEKIEKKDRGNDYYRWNVSSDVGILKLDEWKPDKGRKRGTQTIIEESVKVFLDEHRGNIVACAERLVNLRRDRIRCDRQRWKRYTQCVEFGCPMAPICQAAFTSNPSFEKLREHVRLEHPQEAPDDLDSWIRWTEPYESKPLFPGGPF